MRPEPVTGGTAMTDAPTIPDTYLRLNAEEAALIREALKLLRSTLGRDEAEELDEVKALLRKLESIELE
ncbi:MAG: hypothetical protein A2V85_04165 [Chloroflexi bacterium RBG_16_72_14]|nr:MAG: hypothetical protein A2V85_04165 [Chloroflexi bacterium RBG_16_72_14]